MTKKQLLRKEVFFNKQAVKYQKLAAKLNAEITRLETKAYNLSVARDVAADSYRIAVQRAQEIQALR